MPAGDLLNRSAQEAYRNCLPPLAGTLRIQIDPSSDIPFPSNIVALIMYIPDPPKMLHGRSILQLDQSSFTLDTSGVAGFFGGAEAVSAMATVHILRHRKFLAWYNSPGSYEIAKRYGLITKFGFFFGGGHTEPAELLALFELDGHKGPPFLRVHSGAVIQETGHLAAVFMKECSNNVCRIKLSEKSKNGRQPVSVTIAELDSCPRDDMELKPVDTCWIFRTLAAAPIIVSIATCVLCAAIADWVSFPLILLGIIANGVSTLIIGSIELKFERPRLAGESDSSDKHSELRRVSGILVTPTNIVLLKGREDAAMAVARGQFQLPLPPGGGSFHKCIAFCSLLLLFQFVAQLLLIPQGTLFGQIMFVTSLGTSWCYNLWLCSLDKVGIQHRILFERILKLDKDAVKPYILESWPAMVVFVLLILVFEDEEIKEDELARVLDALIEDTGAVWRVWKSAVLQPLLGLRQSHAVLKDLDAVAVPMEISDADTDGLSEEARRRLGALLEEAQLGVDAFQQRAASV